MVKQTVINARLAQALALARHKDAIVLCDGNMPIPEGCNVVDVSLVRGVPTLLQTLKAVLNDLVAERYQVFELMPQYNPDMYQAIQQLVPQLPGGTISQAELNEQMLRAKAVVRTGDMGSCCTMVLYSASGMEKYVKQFDCAKRCWPRAAGMGLTPTGCRGWPLRQRAPCWPAARAG